MAMPPSATPLARLLAAEMAARGPMPFERFMARCLYDSAHGYYSQPGRVIGRRGDFYTSVSVGPVFGELVAAFVVRTWNEMTRPDSFVLLEQGGHDGQLMEDMLAAVDRLCPELARVIQAILVEPLESRQREQRDRLAGAAARGRIRWIPDLDALASAPVTGILVANELLDAFPVARFCYDGRAWRELAVGWDAAGHFVWQPLAGADLSKPPGSLLPASPAPGLPPNYTTEVSPSLAPWLGGLSRALRHGRGLIFDYGRDADDYFAPHRVSGTLRGYRGHHRCDDPLAAPGETDLTTDVNFTHLAAGARAAGLQVQPPQRQGSFLTALATPVLLGTAVPSPAWRRQFQTLTHPDHLGHRFHAVVVEK